MNLNNRILYLDNIRLYACFLVILAHSHPDCDMSTSVQGFTQAGFWPSLFGFIGFPAPALFFTISGANLLPVKISDGDFFKKRFTKVLFPLLIWSIIYLIAGWGDENKTFVQSLLFLPFKPVIGVFWFMYVICGLYLFAPIVSKWVQSANRMSLKFYLCLWILVSCMSFVNIIYPEFYDISGNYYFILNNFGGFCGYMILGFYLKQYQKEVSLLKFVICVLLFFIFSVFIFLLKSYFNVLPTGFIYNNLSLIPIVYVYLTFSIIQYMTKFFSSIQNFLTEISKHCFGIYLSHILVMQYFTDSIVSTLKLSQFIAIPLMAFLTYFSCYLLIRIIARFSLGKYIAGV